MPHKTIVALFAGFHEASRAAEAVRGLGLRADQVGILADESAPGAGGLGMVPVEVPGIGRRVAHGLLATAFSQDRFIGFADFLALEGVPGRDAEVFAEGIRRGGALVLARAEEDEADKATAVLDHHGADDVELRGSEYNAAGWTRFDEAADVSGAVQISDDRLDTEPVGPLSDAARRMRDAGSSAHAPAPARRSRVYAAGRG